MIHSTSVLNGGAHLHFRRRDYRHRTPSCNRLLFRGYLPPGTVIQIRCPKCGLMHEVEEEWLDVTEARPE